MGRPIQHRQAHQRIDEVTLMTKIPSLGNVIVVPMPDAKALTGLFKAD